MTNTLATRRKQAEKKIRENEERIRQLHAELDVYLGPAWDKLKEQANRQLSRLHTQLVQSDDPEWRIRQMQGEARALRSILYAPQNIRDTIQKAEDTIAAAKKELEDLSR